MPKTDSSKEAVNVKTSEKEPLQSSTPNLNAQKEKSFGSSLERTQLDGYCVHSRFFRASPKLTQEAVITRTMQSKDSRLISLSGGEISNLIDRFKTAIIEKNETFIHIMQYADLEKIPKLISQTPNAPCYLLVDMSSFKLEEIYSDNLLKLLDYNALPATTLICFANANQSDDFHPTFFERFHDFIKLVQSENTASQQLNK